MYPTIYRDSVDKVAFLIKKAKMDYSISCIGTSSQTPGEKDSFIQ